MSRGAEVLNVVGRRRVHVALGVLGISLAALSAPLAAADPVPPADPVVQAVAQPSPPPEAAPAAAPVTPPDGIPHLPSPENLPPGTTQIEPEHPKLGYLRDIWNAVRGKDLSATDALLLFAQRLADPGKVAGSVPANQAVPAPDPVATVDPTAPPVAAPNP